MLELFNEFPRELADPTRFRVNNLKEFLDYINTYNGKKRIFTSLYNYNPDEKLISLRHIWFDLDSEKCFENVKKLHEWCKKHNYKHTMFFSGKGFHFYLLTKNFEGLNDPKQTLYNCHHFIAKEVGLSIGEGDKFDIDWHIVGDVRRVATVPGTYNTKRFRYCVGVLEEDLDIMSSLAKTNPTLSNEIREFGSVLGYEKIKERALKPNLIFKVYGVERFDVKPFDQTMKEFSKPLPYNSKELVDLDKEEALTNLPFCIRAWLTKEHIGWKRRGWIIAWLRDKGLWRNKLNEPLPAMHEEAYSLLKQYLSTKEFNHMNSKEDGWQLRYLYFKNTNNSFPTCDNIKSQGECPLEVSKYCDKRKMFEVRK